MKTSLSDHARRLLYAWLLLFALPAYALDSQAIFERREAAVYQIHVVNRETGKKSSIGSGFVFDQANRLATNYHVVSQYIEKPAGFELRFRSSGGVEGPLQLIAVDAVHDLALVESPTALGEPLAVGAPPAKGASLFAMGNPLDLGLTIAAGTNGGILSQTDDSRILFSGSLNPGMSGGPTFDSEGTVVGINVATARNDISFVVPTRYLLSLAHRSTKSAPPSPEAIGRQIGDYQAAFLDRIVHGDWESTSIRELQVPGAISPTVRCWDTSPKAKEEQHYRRFSISCKNENEIYLSDTLDVGKILYEYIWVESEQLERLRFHHLYRSLNNSQFGGRATRDDVDRFRCDTRFVQADGPVLKSTLCVRDYKQHPGLSDILFTAAMVDRKDAGFIFNLDLSGTDFVAASRLISRLLKEIRWHN